MNLTHARRNSNRYSRLELVPDSLRPDFAARHHANVARQLGPDDPFAGLRENARERAVRRARYADMESKRTAIQAKRLWEQVTRQQRAA